MPYSPSFAKYSHVSWKEYFRAALNDFKRHYVIVNS